MLVFEIWLNGAVVRSSSLKQICYDGLDFRMEMVDTTVIKLWKNQHKPNFSNAILKKKGSQPGVAQGVNLICSGFEHRHTLY